MNKKGRLSGGKCSIAIPELATGIYIVKLQNGKNIFNEKIYIRSSPVF